ncbi:MAG: patatin-like phospholipase family protein [Pseudomonadota bacterium]
MPFPARFFAGSIQPRIRIALAWLFAIALAGCASDAHYPLNRPLTASPALLQPAPQGAASLPSSDTLLVILAFSGGGTRAAALSYGVLETLAGHEVAWAGRSRRLLDEVDLISSVSGGSFTAAYYGLRGERMFGEFETAFLKRDVEAELKDELLKSSNLSRLTSPSFGRSDILAEHYDRILFHGATLGDLRRNGSPRIVINATRMTRGTPFAFTARQFEAIGSSPDSFSVARAVAASSAVPVLFSPIMLRDYRDTSCQGLPPPQGEPPERTSDGCYIHLLDGGLHDNLGLNILLERTNGNDDAGLVLGEAGFPATRRIVVIHVDATAPLDRRWERSASIPPPEAVLEAATSIPLINTNRDTLRELRLRAEAWRAQGLDVSLIEVNLNQLPDSARRSRLLALPTALTLPAAAVDDLRKAARDLLEAHPEFLRLTRAP